MSASNPDSTPQVDESGREHQDENEEVEYTSQEVIDKLSNQLNAALLSGDVAAVERLSAVPCIRFYKDYHLTQMEMVLQSGRLTGDTQEKCWNALSTAWPESVDENLAALTRAAVTGGPLVAVRSLIQKSTHAGFICSLKQDEDYVQGEERKALFDAEMKKAW